MKVLHLTTLLNYGGQESTYISLVQDKSILEYEYVFASIGYGGHAEKIIRNQGFEVTVFNKNPRIKNLKNIWTLYQYIKKIKPNIVHTAASEANFHGIIAAKLAGVPIIIAEEIGFPTHSKKARLVFRFIYKWTKKVVCDSMAVKKYLITIREINEDKGTVIYNPVAINTKIKKVKNDFFTIVSVGRLEKVKNQQALVKVFSKLTNKKSRLILVGEGSERKNLENLIESLNLKEIVQITGFVSNPEIYLAQADLFVLPSLSEGFGIAAVEAMLLHIPCLCSNVGGIPEFVFDNKSGWLFDPKNEKELEEKLNTILSLPDLDLQTIAANGNAFISDKFTNEKYVQNLENFYKELL